MHIHLSKPLQECKGNLNITGSKSESNRLLLLQAFYPSLKIDNLSNSDDSLLMQEALQSTSALIDVHHAGTAMRFLTAYFAVQEGREVTLTGSERMQQRPVKILVEALQKLGADIQYEKKEGYPPLRISGKKIEASSITLQANISSQYISALLLIAPTLPEGLKIELTGTITSVPYIKMTLALMERMGIASDFSGNTIIVQPAKEIKNPFQVVESDWSSASYFFSTIALTKQGELSLNSYRSDSIQGDSCLPDIYEQLGVQTRFDGYTLVLKKNLKAKLPTQIALDLTTAPDIAQTIAVSCYGLGIGCDLTGLHTLKIKETDRLEALQTELTKLGAQLHTTHNSLHLEASSNFKEGIKITTYNDHRMAMAFAPLALKVPLQIQNAEVVSKSYPDFWNDLKHIGFQSRKQ